MFSEETSLDQRENCFELEKFELDMVVLGQLQAFKRSIEPAQRQQYIEFLFSGKRVCRDTFMFLHTLSQKKYCNLLVHYSKAGLVSREHGNLHHFRFERTSPGVVFVRQLIDSLEKEDHRNRLILKPYQSQ